MILNGHGDDIYLECPNQNPNTKQVDNLINLPLEDADSTPIMIFDKDSVLIHHQVPVVGPDKDEYDAMFKGCSMLLDLWTVHTMFKIGWAYEEATELF